MLVLAMFIQIKPVDDDISDIRVIRSVSARQEYRILWKHTVGKLRPNSNSEKYTTEIIARKAHTERKNPDQCKTYSEV